MTPRTNNKYDGNKVYTNSRIGRTKNKKLRTNRVRSEWRKWCNNKSRDVVVDENTPQCDIPLKWLGTPSFHQRLSKTLGVYIKNDDGWNRTNNILDNIPRNKKGTEKIRKRYIPSHFYTDEGGTYGHVDDFKYNKTCHNDIGILNKSTQKYTNPESFGIWYNDYNKSYENFSHLTHEYYLININKKYPFTCTVNELLTIDREGIPVLIDKINNTLLNMKLPTLTKLSLVDYDIFSNNFICISSPKACIQTYSKKKKCYAREILVNSKYPRNDKDNEVLSIICKIVYEDIVGMELSTNGRLIKEHDFPPMENNGFNKINLTPSSYNISYYPTLRKECEKIQKIYYPYLDIDLLYKEFKNSNDKLLIFHGENGSGKTKLSSLLANSFINDGYLSYIIPGTSADNIRLWEHMEDLIFTNINKDYKSLFIIDDIDANYLRRTDTVENKFFNNLLVFLDGNVDLDIKIIITTNYIIKTELDEPLYRAGRLFDIIYARYLNENETKNVLKYNKIKSKDINTFLNKAVKVIDDEKCYKQSDISQYIIELNNNIKREYLKDNNSNNKILRDKIVNKNKIGFM